MQWIAANKVAVAILGIALLFFNPVAICGGMADSNSPAHPCCPKSSPAPQHDSSGNGCVCVDGQSGEPSFWPATGDTQFIAGAVAPDAAAVELPAVERVRAEWLSPGPIERSPQHRQLLL